MGIDVGNYGEDFGQTKALPENQACKDIQVYMAGQKDTGSGSDFVWLCLAVRDYRR